MRDPHAARALFGENGARRIGWIDAALAGDVARGTETRAWRARVGRRKALPRRLRRSAARGARARRTKGRIRADLAAPLALATRRRSRTFVRAREPVSRVRPASVGAAHHAAIAERERLVIPIADQTRKWTGCAVHRDVLVRRTRRNLRKLTVRFARIFEIRASDSDADSCSAARRHREQTGEARTP